MRAMLLAAGRGSRLGVLTEERAKPAVPFANRPMAAVALGALARAGAREVMVNTHHLPHTVEAALRRAAPGATPIGGERPKRGPPVSLRGDGTG